MKLNVKELNNFFKLSGFISNGSILPILSYIKLEKGKLSKTNTNSYIEFNINAPTDISLLLDEKVLKSFLAESKSDEIEVNYTDKKNGAEGTKIVSLIEGKRKIQFQSENVALYPIIPDAEKGKEIVFSSDELEAIGIAAKNVHGTDLRPFLNHVNLWEGHIVGTDANKFFLKKIYTKIENISLTPECSNAICNYNEVRFYQKGKFNCFEVGDVLYSFIQSEVKIPDLTPYVPKEQPNEFMEIDVQEFISFCDTVVSVSSNPILNCKMLGNSLSFYDSDKDIPFDVELKVTGDYKPKISFLAKLFGGYLKTLGFEKVKICPHALPFGLTVWSDEDKDFAGILMGTLNQ